MQVIEGCTSPATTESSKEAIEMSAGTASPISCATRSPAIAITSLSNTTAVGRSARLSSRRMVAEAALGEKSVAIVSPLTPRSPSAVSTSVRSRVCWNSAGPAT